MAQLLALEWDGNEARVALARRRARDVVIEDAFTIDLEPRDAGETFVAPNIGARVAAALTARNISKVETLVAVGRKDIELRLLNVPPVPPEELPDVVRFQAMRQFSALGEDWPLDYLSLASAGETATSVLAATISPDHIKQVRQTCEVGSLTPLRMVLRPMAAASLLSRQLPDAGGRCRLMIDVLSDEADLTVLVGERVVFIRTVRLPNYDGEAQNTALVSELRRTMVAAQNQLGGQRVEYIVVCGNPADHASLVEQLGRDLSLPVESFDPFAALPLADSLRDSLPPRHGRFAPLLGMLLDEADNAAHAIDFLNPRRRPPPPSQSRTYALAGIAAGLLVACGGLYLWYDLRSLQTEALETRQAVNALAPMVAGAESKIKDLSEIEKFTHGDITWLDELHRLSNEKYFPSGEEAILAQLGAAARDGAGGTLQIEGLVRDPSQINIMETRLRDERHSVTGSGSRLTDEDPKYRWEFKEAILITHPDAPLPQAVKPKTPATGTRPSAPFIQRPGSNKGAS